MDKDKEERALGFRVVKVARDVGELGRVQEEAKRELKEMLWREVWRDLVDVPLKVEKVRRMDGLYEVIVEI